MSPGADAAAGGTRTVVAGRYELAELLGSGAAGRVLAARDLTTGSRVAVKLFDPGPYSASPRVRREISALRLLRLPGVVSLLDEGIHDGAPFLVMELVAGRPFPGLKGPLPWDQLAPAALAFLEVLARVHAAGVIHRDLKPSNVLVDAEGRVTVLDFGISWGPALGEAVTTVGTIVGTPQYFAPEQFLGSGHDARTDLYAAGVMFYEALAGRLPHVAADFSDLIELKRSKTPAPLRRIAVAVPRAVAQVVDQLLAMDPEDRPQSAGEVLQALFGREPWTRCLPQIPRLGGDEPLRRLVAAACEGRSLDVSGPGGSGRSRLVSDAAERLAEAGRSVRWAAPGSPPYSSLTTVLGGFDDLANATREEAEAAIHARLETLLRSGVVVAVDDADRLDRWSAAALERCRGSGAVLRVIDNPSPDGIVLSELAETDLREMFAGPDRIFHLREDGASEMWLRTGGLPSRIAVEIGAWVRAGLAHWADGRVLMRREALNRLRGGFGVGDELLLCPGAGSARSLQLDELLAWIALAWPHSTLDILASVTKLPRWTLEPEIEALAEDGMVRRLADGRVLPLVVSRTVASWAPEQRRAAHHALAAALPPGTPLRLRHLAAAAEPDEVVNEALLLAPALTRQGRTGDALVVLQEALVAARGARDAVREGQVLAELAKTSLAEGTAGAADRAFYELSRTSSRTEETARIEQLLRGAREAAAGDAERALRTLAGLSRFDDLDLELWRHGLKIRAALRLPIERTSGLLDEMEAWARGHPSPRAIASLDAWRALHLNRQGHHAEAGRLHRAAADESDRTMARIAAHLNAGNAFLEGGLLSEARGAAETARSLAAACRQPRYEAIAESALRGIAYRLGDAERPDLELVEAAAALDDPSIEGIVALTEAAVAWRAGRPDEARPLAARAARTWRTAGATHEEVVARALELLCGATRQPDELKRLADVAGTIGEPDLAIQALGLVAALSPSDAARLRALAAARAAELGRADRTLRGDVLSVREAVEGLGAVRP